MLAGSKKGWRAVSRPAPWEEICPRTREEADLCWEARRRRLEQIRMDFQDRHQGVRLIPSAVLRPYRGE